MIAKSKLSTLAITVFAGAAIGAEKLPPVSPENGPTQMCIWQDPLGARPRGPQALCGVLPSTLRFSGVFVNLETHKLETVYVDGKSVCGGNRCLRDDMLKMTDAANHLLAIGHRAAVETAGFAQALANEILDEYEDPCVIPGEPVTVYSERAQTHCRMHVVDKMPWYTWSSKASAAITACSAVRARQQSKAADPAPGDQCVGP